MTKIIIVLVLIVALASGLFWYKMKFQPQLAKKNSPSILTPSPTLSPQAKEEWKTYNGEYVTFSYPSTWTPMRRTLSSGSILEEVNLGIPGVTTNQTLGFSKGAEGHSRPDDAVSEENIMIDGSGGYKWIRKGNGYVSYDYTTPYSKVGEDTFAIRVMVDKEDKALERDLDQVMQSVFFKK